MHFLFRATVIAIAPTSNSHVKLSSFCLVKVSSKELLCLQDHSARCCLFSELSWVLQASRAGAKVRALCGRSAVDVELRGSPSIHSQILAHSEAVLVYWCPGCALA